MIDVDRCCFCARARPPMHRNRISLPADRHRQALRLTNSHTLEITTDPSPTEDATRFTEPARTSPTAKMPGSEVAKAKMPSPRRNR